MKLIFLSAVVYLTTFEILMGAEAGMPQLNPEYWASQGFWLVIVFTFLYLLIAKIFIPKIKNNLDDRQNKIKNDLEEAKNLNELADKKKLEYETIILNGKKEVNRILKETKSKLDKEISEKKISFEKELDKEIEKAHKEIFSLKKDSLNSIKKISEDLAAKIIENISGDKLNESSVKAAVSEISKKDLNKYL